MAGRRKMRRAPTVPARGGAGASPSPGGAATDRLSGRGRFYAKPPRTQGRTQGRTPARSAGAGRGGSGRCGAPRPGPETVGRAMCVFRQRRSAPRGRARGRPKRALSAQVRLVQARALTPRAPTRALRPGSPGGREASDASRALRFHPPQTLIPPAPSPAGEGPGERPGPARPQPPGHLERGSEAPSPAAGSTGTLRPARGGGDRWGRVLGGGGYAPLIGCRVGPPCSVASRRPACAGAAAPLP